MLLLLLFHVVLVFHLSLCIHNYRSTTTKLHSNNNTTTTSTKRSIYINCSIFFSDYSCCYCVIVLLLFLFICSGGSTTTNRQQQHETVTPPPKQQHRVIYIYFSVFKSSYLLFIFQCMTYLYNSKTWNEQTNKCKADLMKNCSWPPDASTGGYIWLSIAFANAFLNMSRWPYIVLILPPDASTKGVCLIWNFELISGLALASQRSFLRKTNNLQVVCKLHDVTSYERPIIYR